jgi:phosphatidylinositol glycan class T
VKGHCPLIDEGQGSLTVCMKVPSDRSVFITEGASEIRGSDEFSRCYNLPSSNDFDLVLPEEETKTHVPLEQEVLHTERTIIGHGQERGGMRVIFRNPSPVDSVDFIYFESLPWFVRPYLHTLQATVVGNDGVSRQLPFSEIIKGIYYRPAIDRERGTQLELVLSVPADSTVTLIYDIEKAILRYTEYPPDANRGFNVAPAVIRILGREDQLSVYLRTTGLLLSLPTPDFSMPYNVIILTSTVMALGFGSIFNLLVRRFIPADEPALRAQSLKARLLSRLVVLRDRFKGKTSKQTI